MKYERQKFNQTAAGIDASLLFLAAVGLIIPALFPFTAADRHVGIEREMSITISFILLAIYIATLLFILKTHRHLFTGEAHDASDLGEQPSARGASITVLTVVFVGVILVALVGNAAEHSTAMMVALKNKMDLAYGIAVGSSPQIALLVAPLLVFARYLFGTRLDLIFTPFEVAAVTISVMIVGFVAMDGESN